MHKNFSTNPEIPYMKYDQTNKNKNMKFQQIYKSEPTHNPQSQSIRSSPISKKKQKLENLPGCDIAFLKIKFLLFCFLFLVS